MVKTVKKEERKVSWLYDVILPFIFLGAAFVVAFYPESNFGKSLISIVPVVVYAMCCMWCW